MFKDTGGSRKERIRIRDIIMGHRATRRAFGSAAGRRGRPRCQSHRACSVTTTLVCSTDAKGPSTIHGVLA